MIDALVRKLEEKQMLLARAALGAPQGKTEFEYGRVCGIYSGLEEAKNLLLNAFADKESQDKNL